LHQKSRSKVWQEEYRYIKGDGSIAAIYAQGYISVDHNNKPVRLVGTIRDITDAKAREVERDLMIKELTRSNNDLKQFSFITSHNLRAPLSNILGILHIVDSSTLDENNKCLLEMIGKSAAQLKQTLDDLGKILLIKNNNVEISKIELQATFNSVSRIFVNSFNDIAAVIKQISSNHPFILIQHT
jgi:light-regulated signal transduction histidine kinase (bacteriophytochrome)